MRPGCCQLAASLGNTRRPCPNKQETAIKCSQCWPEHGGQGEPGGAKGRRGRGRRGPAGRAYLQRGVCSAPSGSRRAEGSRGRRRQRGSGARPPSTGPSATARRGAAARAGSAGIPWRVDDWETASTRRPGMPELGSTGLTVTTAHCACASRPAPARCRPRMLRRGVR